MASPGRPAIKTPGCHQGDPAPLGNRGKCLRRVWCRGGVQMAPRGRAGCAAQPAAHSTPHTTKNSAPLSPCRGCTLRSRARSSGPGLLWVLFLLSRVLLSSLRVSGYSSALAPFFSRLSLSEERLAGPALSGKALEKPGTCPEPGPWARLNKLCRLPQGG